MQLFHCTICQLPSNCNFSSFGCATYWALRELRDADQILTDTIDAKPRLAAPWTSARAGLALRVRGAGKGRGYADVGEQGHDDNGEAHD